MLYLDTGRPSFASCSVPPGQTPQVCPKDPANKQRDLSHNCVRTAEARRKSAFVCGCHSQHGTEFAWIQSMKPTQQDSFTQVLWIQPLTRESVLPGLCCIVAIRKFDAEKLLTRHANRMCRRPYRGGSNKPGVTSYVDKTSPCGKHLEARNVTIR